MPDRRSVFICVNLCNLWIKTYLFTNILQSKIQTCIKMKTKTKLAYIFTLCAFFCPGALAGDLHTAWEQRGSLLEKSIVYTGEQGESPRLKWDSSLTGLRVSVELRDVLGNKVIVQKDNLTSGGMLRGGHRELSEGIYKVTYTSNQESVSEYLVIGSPKAVFENLKKELGKTSIKDAGARLNIEAQVKREEILCSRENYDIGNEAWQQKAAHTLGSLASMIAMQRDGRQSVANDIAGLHIRGIKSKIDGSTQYYRVYIPASLDRSRAMPLLVVMPTPFEAREKPFVASVFMESHRQAVLLGHYAEKHGFAVLWPGYKNPLEGFTLESTHVAEVISAVQRDWNIDGARISVYGACGGGYFAGRLIATYPRRFAAIVYNRAVFERNIDLLRGFTEPPVEWHEAINPADAVIGNSHIRIFVLNDGAKLPGHGDIELSEKFVARAKKQRSDVEAHIANAPMKDAVMWDKIFTWISPCWNEEPGEGRSDFLKKLGYEGPISEVFSTPFIIVRGTASDSADAARIDATVEHLKESYKKMFYGAVPIIKNDSEVTEQEIDDYSLILIGNPESNAVWKKLEARLPVAASGSKLVIKGREFPANSAFTAVFAHPLNSNAYVLTIGAYDLTNLGLTRKADPFKAWYDCRVFEPTGEQGQTHTVSKLD